MLLMKENFASLTAGSDREPSRSEFAKQCGVTWEDSQVAVFARNFGVIGALVEDQFFWRHNFDLKGFSGP